MRTPSDSSSSQRLGTGHVESPVVNSTTSWPAVANPWASRSTTSSIPPYRCGGTGAQGGATSPMRIRRITPERRLTAPARLVGVRLWPPAHYWRDVLRTVVCAMTEVTGLEPSNFTVSGRIRGEGRLDDDDNAGRN